VNDRMFKLIGTGAAIGAAALAKQVSEKGWKAVMASDPPANPEDPDTELWEAIAWAVASGAVIAVARMMASRQWTKYYTKSTGHAPANPNEVS
jgi:thiazole synthase ThiGH ThiG subunit